MYQLLHEAEACNASQFCGPAHPGHPHSKYQMETLDPVLLCNTSPNMFDARIQRKTCSFNAKRQAA